MKEKYNRYLNDEIKFDRLTMFGIICLIIVIAGIFGFVYEVIFYYLNSGMKTIYYRGGNFLPWINIYAIGALLIFLLTFKHKKNALKIFLLSSIICGVLEYIAGWGMYHFSNHFRCWDYNTEIFNFGNINGYVCLRSVLFFGLSSLMLIYLIIPVCFYIARRFNRKVFIILSILVCSIFIIDEGYNLLVARALNLPRASYVYKQIGLQYMDF